MRMLGCFNILDLAVRVLGVRDSFWLCILGKYFYYMPAPYIIGW